MFQSVYHVECDGEEVTVHNEVNISGVPKIVRGFNPCVEDLPSEAEVRAGKDGSEKPEAVTPRLARRLDDRFGIEVENRGIEVIDPKAEEVESV